MTGLKNDYFGANRSIYSLFYLDCWIKIEKIFMLVITIFLSAVKAECLAFLAQASQVLFLRIRFVQAIWFFQRALQR